MTVHPVWSNSDCISGCAEYLKEGRKDGSKTPMVSVKEERKDIGGITYDRKKGKQWE